MRPNCVPCFAWCKWLSPVLLLTLLQVGLAQEPSHQLEQMIIRLSGDNTQYPQSLEVLKQGLTHFEGGRYRQAMASLSSEALLKTQNADLAVYFMAESCFHAGEFAHAQSVLAQFNTRFPLSKWRDFARARYADVLRATGGAKAALAVLQDLLVQRPDYPHPGALKISIGMALDESGHAQGSVDWLHRFTVEFPKNIYRTYADQKLKGLSRRGFKPKAIAFDDALTIAQSLRKRRLHEDGLNWVRHLKKRELLSKEQRWMVGYHEARMLLNARQFRLSIEHFESLAKSAPSSKWRLRTHKWRSRAFEGLGQVENAVQQQDAYWRSSDFLTPKRRAARGELYLRHGEFGKAADWFSNLTLRRSRQGRRLRVLKPIAEFAAGRANKAKALFEIYFKAGFEREVALKYWRARIDAATKDTDAAIQGYTEILDNHSGYYAEQSRARLKALEVEYKDNWTVAPSAAHEARASRYQALFAQGLPDSESMIRFTSVYSMWVRAGDVFPDLKTAFEQLYLGRTDDAIWHLRKVTGEVLALRGASAWRRKKWNYVHRELLDFRKGAPRGPWGDVRTQKPSKSSRARVKAIAKLDLKHLSQQLAFTFESVGDYYFVLKLLHSSKASELSDPPTRRQLELRYPKAYKDIVMREAKLYGIEANLMWALMRTESHFNTLAISPAEARGLMQVIWQTAQRISESGGFVDMGNAQILLPRVSIALGAYYVSSLLRKFGGQLPFAFAGYNAGPHRVSAWLDRKPDMKMDQFIEEIQYEEARAYVKKVLDSLLTYRRLYDQTAGSWIGQIINRKYTPEPDY